MHEEPEIPGPPNGQPISRVLTDATGVGWTVWEIGPGSLPPNLRRLLGKDAERGGVLLFVSEANEWRSLTPVPADWAKLDESELEACRVRARRLSAD
jgi:hypothetical protein